jgi:hypothetical protein
MEHDNTQTKKPPQLLAIAFIQDARAFISDAETLLEANSQGTGASPFSAPTYYLLCHAMELALKGYLASSGVPKNKLQFKIGHDLEKALSQAQKRGFVPADDRFAELIEWLGPFHLDHSFRYRKTGLLRLPAPAIAVEVIKATIAGLEPHVRSQFLAFRERASNPSEAG